MRWGLRVLVYEVYLLCLIKFELNEYLSISNVFKDVRFWG